MQSPQMENTEDIEWESSVEAVVARWSWQQGERKLSQSIVRFANEDRLGQIQEVGEDEKQGQTDEHRTLFVGHTIFAKGKHLL